MKFADVGPRHCRWIEGDVNEDTKCCGKRAVKNTPWCVIHQAKVFINRPKPRKIKPIKWYEPTQSVDI